MFVYRQKGLVMHQLEQAASIFGPVVAGYIPVALSCICDLVTNEKGTRRGLTFLVMTKGYEYESGK